LLLLLLLQLLLLQLLLLQLLLLLLLHGSRREGLVGFVEVTVRVI
jgi:hypothetical protein